MMRPSQSASDDRGFVPVRRALISVSDKAGIVEFAQRLAAFDVEIISTGGTAKALQAAGIAVTHIERVTGFPEMMGGRVKTLHPKIHGGLLALRDDPEHAAAAAAHAIAPIDLLCVNLYPFEETVSVAGVSLDEAIEQIDIGGPAMIRSAAKNSKWVAVVTSPFHYGMILADMHAHGGATSGALRRRLAADAFARTSEYDHLIQAYLYSTIRPTSPEEDEDGGSTFSPTLKARLKLVSRLRYGENPHQHGAMYTIDGNATGSPPTLGVGIPQARQVHGKELSYNNINDAAAALELAWSVRRATGMLGASVIKHASPCGAACAGSPVAAVDAALRGDPLAAYGGILALSGAVDVPAAQRLCDKSIFLEVLVAELIDPEALVMLRDRWANLRILETGALPAQPPNRVEVRSVPGGLLVQSADQRLVDVAELRHAAGPPATADQLACVRFLEPVARALMSNAIAIGGPDPATGMLRLFGAGAGQMDRVAACKIAVEKAGASAHGAVAFSDAFFPFPDGPQVLIDAGVTVLVHPGGSKRDQETFDLCNAREVCCITTGVRHFRH